MVTVVRLLSAEDVCALAGRLRLPAGADRLDLLHRCLMCEPAREALWDFLFRGERQGTPPPPRQGNLPHGPPGAPMARGLAAPECPQPPAPACKRCLDFDAAAATKVPTTPR